VGGPPQVPVLLLLCVCGFIQTYGHWKKGWNLKLAGGFLYSRPNVVWLFTCRVHFHFLFGRSAIVNIGSCDPHYSRRIEELWRPSQREWKGAIFKTTNIGAHSITLLLKYCVAARSSSKANRAKVVGYTRRTLYCWHLESS
jgi:hypothetical protein